MAISIDEYYQQGGRAPQAGAAAPGQATQPSERTIREVVYGTDINTVAPPAWTADGAVVTFQDRQGRRFGLNEALLSKHLLLLGGIGSGKSNVFYFLLEGFLRRLKNDDIILIFDTKGDFYQKFYDSWNPNHIVLGNGAAFAAVSKRWDLFGELRDANGQFTKESELMAKEIARGLFVGRESETQPFFSLAASDLVAKVMIHLMRASKRGEIPEPTTADFVQFLKRANLETYQEMLQNPQNPDFASALSYIGDAKKPTGQTLGVLGFLNAMVNDLFVGIFAEHRPGNDISMRQLVRQKGAKVVFVEYDLSVGEVLGPIYRVLFDEALKEALRNTDHRQGNVYLMIDEFKLLPNLQHIDDALNFGRSLGIKVCAGLQSINQLYDIYGEHRGKVLASGFMNSFCFQTWDLDSRQFISDRFGETYENLTIRGTDVQREGRVVSDWDILNLEVGEAFINLTGQPPIKPFRFRFPQYRG
jgi:hypothetical protein